MHMQFSLKWVSSGYQLVAGGSLGPNMMGVLRGQVSGRVDMGWVRCDGLPDHDFLEEAAHAEGVDAASHADHAVGGLEVCTPRVEVGGEELDGSQHEPRQD